MAEHDSDREDREEREDREDREPSEQNVPFDEEAAWAAIVEGYGDEPKDPPGAKPFKSVEDLALLESDTNETDDGGPKDGKDGKDAKGTTEVKEEKPAKPLGGSVAFAPGVGPRDYSAPEPVEPVEEDFEEDDEGHFVPPEPPPLPAADPAAKFAWLGLLGGPVLLLLAVLLGWDMTWWLATLGIGGFLGGFATLVMRMRTEDEDDDDPGRGAVV